MTPTEQAARWLADVPRLWLGAENSEHECEVWFDPDEGGTEYVQTDAVIAAIARHLAPVLVKPWAYCPECGETETHYEQGDHKQCAKCYQEWFADIDYSEVVRGNLNRLFLAALDTPDADQTNMQKVHNAPDAGVVAELVGALRDIADPKRLTSHGDPAVLRNRAATALALIAHNTTEG